MRDWQEKPLPAAGAESDATPTGYKYYCHMVEMVLFARLDPIKALVLNGLGSPHSRRNYDRALSDFLAWYSVDGAGQGFTKATVQRWAQRLAERGLAPSTRNLALSAVRRLALEAADNGLMAPELAAAIGRVKGAKQAGVRTGNWLDVHQAERLINAPDRSTLKGKRDRALLAVLIGCGLRRAEASALTFGDVQQRDGRWVIVDLVGKGNRLRSVSMPSWAKAAIDDWAAAAGIGDGRVFRSLRNARLGANLLPQNVMETVTKYGAGIGVPHLAPHDLRRTFAKLAHKGRAALEQIQLALGHASIQTTERYLGVQQDLVDSPCDHLGLKLA